MRPGLHRATMHGGSRLVTVRHSNGAYVKGEWREAGANDTEHRMRVHPVSPSDRKLVPEGMRSEDSLAVITHIPLAVEGKPGVGGAADRIYQDGSWWIVVAEKPWGRHGFHKYIAVRRDKGQEVNR